MTTSEPKALSHFRAVAERDERNRSTGYVEVCAVPTWLKSNRYAVGRLTPAEAIALATELLKAVQRAEVSRG